MVCLSLLCFQFVKKLSAERNEVRKLLREEMEGEMKAIQEESDRLRKEKEVEIQQVYTR